jgi:hypothetical protein
MHLSPIDYLLASAALVCALVQTFTLRILAKRKLRAEFPVFFWYSAYGVLIGVLGCVGSLWSACSQYYYVFWACTIIMFCLEFGVMYEIFVNTMKPYSALIDLGKMVFRWAAVFLILVALLTSIASNGTETNRIVAAITLTQHSLRLMQGGLLLLFFSFEKRLGLSWRSYGMSVALGLGVAASVDLITSYLGSRFVTLEASLNILGIFVYLGVATFWAVCFRRPEPARKNVLDSPSRLIFQRWNEALSSSGYGQSAAASSTVESFLPGIEKTVDRVMARKAVS